MKAPREGTEAMSKKASRKNIVYILYANREYLAGAFAKALGCTEAEFIETIEDWACAMGRASSPAYRTPSYEQTKNVASMVQLAEQVNAEGVECTASGLAGRATDATGYPMTSKKIGHLLKRAHEQGLISKSPEPWPVGHYGPLGFEDWARKPTRRKTVNIEDLYEDENE